MILWNHIIYIHILIVEFFSNSISSLLKFFKIIHHFFLAFPPNQQAFRKRQVNTDYIQVDADTRDMLKERCRQGPWLGLLTHWARSLFLVE
jgi:hypothetical protein